MRKSQKGCANQGLVQSRELNNHGRAFSSNRPHTTSDDLTQPSLLLFTLFTDTDAAQRIEPWLQRQTPPRPTLAPDDIWCVPINQAI